MVTKAKNKMGGGEKHGEGKPGKKKALKLGKETVKELGDEDMDKVAGGLLGPGGARIEGLRDPLVVGRAISKACMAPSAACQGSAIPWSCERTC